MFLSNLINRALIVIAIALSLAMLPGCEESKPIRIGFIGELTTRASGLATSGRDGFLLAIEEINAHGGINGRQVEGLVVDARMHKETALHAIHKLADGQVSAIIGPMTSQTAVTIVPAINNLKIPLISPTVSTNELSGIDDYFFRVYYTNAQAAQLLANYLTDQGKPLHIAAIYDLSNRAYTEDWVQYFQDMFEKQAGSNVTRIPFDIRSNTLYIDLATRAIEANPDGVLLLANAVDTAMICQQLAKLQAEPARYATGWSYSDDLIQFGGKSVEGLAIIQSADPQDPAPAMQSFVKRYKKRFRTTPNFPAVHAYDATRLALSIMREETDPEAIRNRLLNMEYFSGLQSDLSIDRFGELQYPKLHLARIVNGQFIISD
jgi:branched-chain amino acid transport system substrate-binding protein